jgi:hypothetical protein
MVLVQKQWENASEVCQQNTNRKFRILFFFKGKEVAISHFTKEIKNEEILTIIKEKFF